MALSAIERVPVFCQSGSVDLDAISDRLDIEALLIRYTRAIDSGDWDRLDEVFTPDAAIDYTATGGIEASYAEVKPWLAEMLPIFPRRMHTLGQIDSQVTGDTAVVAAYFHNPMGMPQEDGTGPPRRVRRDLPPRARAYAGRLALAPPLRGADLEEGHVAPMDTKPEGLDGEFARRVIKLMSAVNVAVYRAHARPRRRHLARRGRLEGPGADLSGGAPRSSYRQAAHHAPRLPARRRPGRRGGLPGRSAATPAVVPQPRGRPRRHCADPG